MCRWKFPRLIFAQYKSINTIINFILKIVTSQLNVSLLVEWYSWPEWLARCMSSKNKNYFKRLKTLFQCHYNITWVNLFQNWCYTRDYSSSSHEPVWKGEIEKLFSCIDCLILNEDGAVANSTETCWFRADDQTGRQAQSDRLIGHFRVPGPLYQNEFKFSAFDVEMTFILMQIILIFTWKDVHLASFRKWGSLELGSGLL